MSTRRWVFLLLSVSFSLVLSACGGGSSMHVAPMAPMFTSTPPTTALQDTAYSYAIAATDPAGGTVSFALSTGPTGAAVSGNNLSWTPAAAQSRLANSFTVTATTSEGGTATQSWSVSPAGTVTVNWVETYWTPSGKQLVPVPTIANIHVAAAVPQSDGSVNVIPGSLTAAGVVSIPGVPAGYFWLTFGPALGTLPPLAYWTSTSTFDAGRDLSGAPVPVASSSSTTTLDFNLSGLDSVASPTSVGFNPGMPLALGYFPDPADSTTLSTQLNIGGNIDWSQLKTAFLLQYEPETLGPWSNLVLGASAYIPNLSLTNGTTNTITQTLASSAPASLDVNILGSQWPPLFQNASPAAPTQFSAGMSLVTEPWVTGVDSTVGIGDVTLASAMLQVSGNGFGFQPFGGCDAVGFPLLGVNTNPAILTDQDLGTMSYGDPFSSTWTRAFTFCQEAIAPVALPSGSMADFSLVSAVRMAPSNTAIAPLVGPVLSPTIAGGSLFTAATLNTVAPTISWSAPGVGSANGYRVQVFVATTLSDGTVRYAPAGAFSTIKTSITLLPLLTGKTYVFSITSLADTAANFETHPYRASLPSGSASVVSAPITISGGAAQARIRGDARAVRQLSQPRVDSGKR